MTGLSIQEMIRQSVLCDLMYYFFFNTRRHACYNFSETLSCFTELLVYVKGRNSVII